MSNFFSHHEFVFLFLKCCFFRKMYIVQCTIFCIWYTYEFLRNSYTVTMAIWNVHSSALDSLSSKNVNLYSIEFGLISFKWCEKCRLFKTNSFRYSQSITYKLLEQRFMENVSFNLPLRWFNVELVTTLTKCILVLIGMEFCTVKIVKSNLKRKT